MSSRTPPTPTITNEPHPDSVHNQPVSNGFNPPERPHTPEETISTSRSSPTSISCAGSISASPVLSAVPTPPPTHVTTLSGRGHKKSTSNVSSCSISTSTARTPATEGMESVVQAKEAEKVPSREEKDKNKEKEKEKEKENVKVTNKKMCPRCGRSEWYGMCALCGYPGRTDLM